MSYSVSADILEEFKDRMSIFHSSQDNYLKDVLETSYEDISNLIGEFALENFKPGKELVFDRARYVYNDQIEFFYTNFQHRFYDLSMELILRKDGEGDGDSSEIQETESD